MSRKLTKGFRSCECKFDPSRDYMDVIPDASMSPTQLKELADRGIAISNANLEINIDGKNTWSVPPAFKKGMDMATAWNQEQTAKRLVKSSINKDKSNRFISSVKEAKKTQS